MKHCVAIVHGDAGAFGVSFPDLPGCITSGATLDDALARAAEVVTFHLEGLALAGEPIPTPRSLDALRADREFRSDFRGAITVALVPYNGPGKIVRINLTLDKHLLEAIDRAARASGSSRSGFLAEAARARLNLRQQ